MNIFDFGTGGDCFLIEINGLFGLAKTIAQHIEFVVKDRPKLFFTFHYSSPTLAYLGNQPGGEVLSRKGQSLTLIASHVAAHKEGGRSDHIVRRHQLFAVPSS